MKLENNEEKFQQSLNEALERSKNVKKYCALISDQDTIDLLQKSASDIEAFVKLIRVYDKNISNCLKYNLSQNKKVRDMIFKIAIYENLVGREAVEAIDLLTEKRVDRYDED